MNEEVESARAWLLMTVASQVDRPEEAHVEVLIGRRSVIFEVSTAPEDVRRVIGRGGRTKEGITTLLKNIGNRVGLDFQLTILEPQRRGGGGAVVRSLP